MSISISTIQNEGVFDSSLRGQINTAFATIVANSNSFFNYATTTLTNAQIKALRATPVALVAAPGAGYMNVFRGAVLQLNAGTNVLTESADNLGIKYTNGSGVQVSNTIEATGFIDQSADTATSAIPSADAIVAKSAAENAALVLHNLGDGEFAGNAAADATLTVGVWYAVVPVVS